MFLLFQVVLLTQFSNWMKIRKRGGNPDWQQEPAPDWTTSLASGVSEAKAAIFTLVSDATTIVVSGFIVSETQTGWGFVFYLVWPTVPPGRPRPRRCDSSHLRPHDPSPRNLQMLKKNIFSILLKQKF